MVDEVLPQALCLLPPESEFAAELRGVGTARSLRIELPRSAVALLRAAPTGLLLA